MSPIFLTVEQVSIIHARQIDLYGGEGGVRDANYLESAIYAPQQTVFGEWAYPTLVAKAGAYWHGLCMNHPFFDGNKRVALDAALIFLEINGLTLDYDLPEERLEEMTLAIASGKVSREAAIEFLETVVVPLDRTRD